MDFLNSQSKDIELKNAIQYFESSKESTRSKFSKDGQRFVNQEQAYIDHAKKEERKTTLGLKSLFGL